MPDNLTDPSHSTEAFRAFVQGNGNGGEPERIWAMRAPRGKVLTLAAIVIGVAVVIAIVSLAVA
jgi:multisubunit Na+/H+ antiporter MnhC subunit